MPINVTVTNSEKIALPEIIKNVTIYISSFKIKFQSMPFCDKRELEFAMSLVRAPF